MMEIAAFNEMLRQTGARLCLLCNGSDQHKPKCIANERNWRDMGKQMVEIACEVIMETEKAYQIDDGATKCWVPKSQVDWHPDGTKGSGTMVMPEFLAKEKGLI